MGALGVGTDERRGVLRGRAAKIRAQSLKSRGAVVQNDDDQKPPGTRQAAVNLIQPPLRAVNAELCAHKEKSVACATFSSFLTLCQHGLLNFK